MADTNRSINGLQYLRGVAALMVVLFHSRSYFSSFPVWTGVGARGVDIFFVISGFIMAYTTRRVMPETGVFKASLFFLSKRMIRVVPLYWVALLWTAAPYWLGWIAASHSFSGLVHNFTPDLAAIAKDFVFIPHATVDPDEQDGIYPILIQGWTINYEMFFYALFGVALLKPQFRLLSTSVVLVTLVAIGTFIHFHTILPLFYTSASLLQFVLGMLLYQLYQMTRDVKIDPGYFILFGAIGFLLLYRGSLVNDKLVMGVAATIIVWVFVHAFRGVQIRALKVLGDASYSIYLFHAAVFVEVRTIIKSLGIHSDGAMNVTIIVVAQVVPAIVMGIVIYYVIEKPLLRIMRRGAEHLLARFSSRPASIPAASATARTPGLVDETI